MSSCVPWKLCVLLFSGFILLAAAQSPPPPKLLSSPPPPPDYSISTKCSSLLNADDQQKVMKMGENLDLIFAPMVMACEEILCTKMYMATCSPQRCPKCKLYAGPANRFRAQVEDMNGENAGVPCDVTKISIMYLITCNAKNGLANLTVDYALKIYAQQLNGSTSVVNDTASIVFQAGDISIQNSGPGYWPNGNELAVGQRSSFMFPVKDKYNNVKTKSSGAATDADIKESFGQLDMRSSSYLNSFSLKYDKESGYVTVTFIPTTLGTWPLFLGQIEVGYILNSPYMYKVVSSGTLSTENCTASWLNNVSSFKAGDQAVLRVLLADSYNNNISASTGRKAFYRFNVFSNNSLGEVNYNRFNVSFDNTPGYERITFTPTIVGDFVLHVGYNDVEAQDSPFNFTVTAGPVSISNCQGFWLNNLSTFTAGQEATLQVFMMDAYNNNISSYSEGLNFSTYIMDITGRKTSAENIQQVYDGNSMYQLIIFNTSISGDLFLQVGRGKISIIGSPFPFYVDPGDILPSACQGFWPNNISTFLVGETATLGVIYMDSYKNSINASDISAVNISATIQSGDGSGNFSILNTDSQGSPGFGTIDFMSFSSGSLFLQVMVNDIEIASSPFSFQMVSGLIYAPNCKGAWSTETDEFQAGIYTSFIIFLMDAFNNSVIPNVDQMDYLDFTAYGLNDNGVAEDLYNLTFTEDRNAGLETLRFLATYAGNFSLYVQYNGTNISGSPFSYSVTPGPISVTQCMGYWENGSGVYGAADIISLYVLLIDSYYNNVTVSTDANAFVNFTVKIKTMQGGTYSTYITLGAQDDSGYETITFNNTKAGDYLLYVTKKNLSILGSPFPYTVQPGPLSSSNCQVKWLNESTYIEAGKQANAEVLFVDAYNNSVNSYINFTTYFTCDGQTFQDVSILSRRQSGNQQISFIITLLGDYSLHFVSGGNVELNGSPLNFSIVTASISPSHCKGAWVDDDSTFNSGEHGALMIFLMDAFNNIVSASAAKETSFLRFSAYVTNKDFSKNSTIKISVSPDASGIYETITIYPTMSGDCLLYVLINQIQIHGSPFAFTLASGVVYVPNCIGSWQNGTNVFNLGQQVMFKVVLKDDSNTSLASTTDISFTMSVMDLKGKKTKMRPMLLTSSKSDYVLVTFNATTKGDFLLRIGDTSSQMKNSPFLFSVLPGVGWRYFH